MDDKLIKFTEWSKIIKFSNSGGLPMPFTQEIFLLKCDVAGLSFTDDIERKIRELSNDSVVSLIREPDNPYDASAIRVENEKREKLGYIPRNKNEVLANLMDSGKMLYGKVTGKIDSEYVIIHIAVKVFMKDL